MPHIFPENAYKTRENRFHADSKFNLFDEWKRLATIFILHLQRNLLVSSEMYEYHWL